MRATTGRSLSRGGSRLIFLGEKGINLPLELCEPARVLILDIREILGGALGFGEPACVVTSLWRDLPLRSVRLEEPLPPRL